jgi:ureidoacrylate peracid hydrolase
MTTPSSDVSFDLTTTALLVVDPYNDFISEGGILWPAIRDVAEKVGCVPHMSQLVQAARSAGVQIIIVPHHRWKEGDYAKWRTIAPIQAKASASKLCQEGSWGAEFHPSFLPQAGDLVASQHWCSSGFANTDLDLLLKRHGLHQLIICGLIANTCIESTLRFAVELGYEAVLVKDATAARSDEEMTAAIQRNLPYYARAILTTEEVLKHLKTARLST